ncbi:nodulation protein NfeD [Candidatus Poribacteria bacterium]|nr:nodulation protein NfeD [Candidatus Poribacteria bacterium]
MKKYILPFILFLLILGMADSALCWVSLLEFDNLVINPVTSGFITRSITRANEDGAECLIIRLDTPGGLQKSMEDIYKAILVSPLPIVVYVAPEGAQATSAGVFIALSAHVVAMAPTTKIGSAHPVAVGGGQMDDDVKNKIIEHTVAEVKKIAEKRGRNVEWAEKAVRDSISSTWTEALEQNVIDFVAEDMGELLEKLDGMEVKTEAGERVLNTRYAEVRRVKMNLRDRLLNIISDPNIAYMLLILGFYGIFFELSNPGSIFPGVAGAISIILALFALQTLPINYAGLLLILLALVLFILEVKVVSYGILSIGGIISMLIGSIMLIDSAEPFAYIFKISWQIILPAVLVTAGFFILGMILVIKTHRKKSITGKQGLMGAVGVCEREINPEGKIFLHGEIWNGISDEVILPKEKVRVIGAEGLTLKVEKLKDKEI